MGFFLGNAANSGGGGRLSKAHCALGCFSSWVPLRVHWEPSNELSSWFCVHRPRREAQQITVTCQSPGTGVKQGYVPPHSARVWLHCPPTGSRVSPGTRQDTQDSLQPPELHNYPPCPWWTPSLGKWVSMGTRLLGEMSSPFPQRTGSTQAAPYREARKEKAYRFST